MSEGSLIIFVKYIENTLMITYACFLWDCYFMGRLYQFAHESVISKYDNLNPYFRLFIFKFSIGNKYT